jgi:hypothetical protein
MGRENEASLTMKLNMMSNKTKSSFCRVDLEVNLPKERKNARKATSGGGVGRKSICARQEALREFRGVYHNLCADLHCERGCGCLKPWPCEREDCSAPVTILEGGSMQAAVLAHNARCIRENEAGMIYIYIYI